MARGMDYRKVMGVEDLAARYGAGKGTSIAILDSGKPEIRCFPAARYSDPECGADVFGHATSIASILFGGNGIYGVCEGAHPIYFKTLDDSGRGSVKSVIRGIEAAIDSDADLINLSLGFMRTEKCPKSLKKACEKAYEAKKSIICAAGNDGGPVNWPAALETTICVGSAGENGLKMPFSSVGEVDFVAPGCNLKVLDVKGHWTTVSGTSFSCALVSGVAALLIAEMKACNDVPDLDLVRSALIGLSRDVGDVGWDKKTGYGLISRNNFDSTVCMMPDSGFFDKIIGKIKSLVGLKNTKESTNGSRV